MVGRMDSPKKGAVGLQQCKASSKGKEGCMTSKMEEEYWSHCGVTVIFMRVVMDVTRRPPQGRINVSVSLGYLRQHSPEEEAMCHDA
jgi:hypothetical protein